MPVPIDDLHTTERQSLAAEKAYDAKHGRPQSKIALEQDIEMDGHTYRVIVKDVPDRSFFGTPEYGRHFAFEVDGICGTGSNFYRPEIALAAAREAIARKYAA